MKSRSKPLSLEALHLDSHGNHYLTLLVGENSANPLKVDFYRVGTPDGEQFMCLISDEKSLDAVMVAKQTLRDILEDGWKTHA
jgi:rRNA maturation protein Rpf1